ncbi:Eco57I restriction-modification methylase domain-containing protein [Maridesulfovibrio sp.]|uniref:Eco57I restriction-modification methylase domain-containing protein n=1 Tax=Maridesulfovibrio sp. TaxID=2795000 RepID=UPI003BA95C59
MIDEIAAIQNEYLLSKPETRRKELGQFFTGSIIADYMASMIQIQSSSSVRLLDAGAGAGILTVAAALHCLSMGCKSVHAVLYDIDKETLPLLNNNMKKTVCEFVNAEATFTYEIRNEDFILARPDKKDEKYHVASINPPYFKYNSKTSPYANATDDLYKGNPNIYASFMAVVSGCLHQDGQMIAIVPRSFTNGLYFKGFRQYMNMKMSLEKIHIFRSRNKVFKELAVLQEHIICSYYKREQSKNIQIFTSNGHADIDNSEIQTYLSRQIIDFSNDHEFIRIPESLEDAEILRRVESWTQRFSDSCYFISTGPVVEFRTREFITGPENTEDSVPLLRMHNVKSFKTEWTGLKKKDARFLLTENHNKHTLPNSPYVILKRFSSKDEKRRLVAGVHDPKKVKGGRIAIENHLNYISCNDGSLSLTEAYGLALFFNSTLIDRYFRCISGNTQVNATEIRMLKIPSVDILKLMGQAYIKGCVETQDDVDEVVEEYLQ